MTDNKCDKVISALRRRFGYTREASRILKEVLRLVLLPNHGVFTLLHHQKPTEVTNNLLKRILYIINSKRYNEVHLRLRHIRYIEPNRGQRISYDFYISRALTLIPRCRWSYKEYQIIGTG